MEIYLRFATEVTNRFKKSDLEEHRRVILDSSDCLRVCFNSLAILLDSKLLEPLDIPEDVPSEPDPIARYFCTPLLPRTTEKLREWDHTKRKALALETALLLVDVARSGLSQLIKRIDKEFDTEAFYVRTLAILIHLTKKSQNISWIGEPKEESDLCNENNTLTTILCNLILIVSLFATEEVGLFSSFRELPKSLLSLLPKTLNIHILGIIPTLAFDPTIFFSLKSRESLINSLSDQFFDFVDHLVSLTKIQQVSFDPPSDEVSYTVDSGLLEDSKKQYILFSTCANIYRHYLSNWLRFAIDHVKYGSLLCKNSPETCCKLISWLSRVLEYRPLNVIGNLLAFEDVSCFEDIVKLAKMTTSNLYVSSLIYHSSLTTQESLNMIKIAGIEILSRDSASARDIFSFLMDGLASNDIIMFLESWRHLLYSNNIDGKLAEFIIDNYQLLLDRLLPLSVFDFKNIKAHGLRGSNEDRPAIIHSERDNESVFLVRDVITLLVSVIGSACTDRLLSSFELGYAIISKLNILDQEVSAVKGFGTYSLNGHLFDSSWNSFSSEEIGTLEFSLFIVFVLRNECNDSKKDIFIEKIKRFNPNVDERIEFILHQIENDDLKHLHLSDAFRVFSLGKKFRSLIDSNLDWIQSFNRMLRVSGRKSGLQFGDGNIFQFTEREIVYFKYPILVEKNSATEGKFDRWGIEHLFTEFGTKMASSIVHELSIQIGVGSMENQLSSRQNSKNHINNEFFVPKHSEIARNYLEMVSLLLRIYRECPHLIPKGKKGQHPKELPIFQVSLTLLAKNNDLLRSFVHILTDLVICGITSPLRAIGPNTPDIQTFLLCSLRCILAEVLKCDKIELIATTSMSGVFDFIANFAIKSLDGLVSLSHWSSGNYQLFTILLEILAYSFQIGPILRFLLEDDSKMQIIFKTILIANTLVRFQTRFLASRSFLNLSLITRLLCINPRFNSETRQNFGMVKSGYITGDPGCVELINQQLDRILMKNCANFQITLDEVIDPVISGSFNLLDVIAYVSFKQVFKGSTDLKEGNFINFEENPLFDINYGLLEKLCVIESSVFHLNLLDVEYRLSLECIERLFSGFSQLPQTKLLLIAEYFFIVVASSTGREYSQVKAKFLKDNVVKPDAALFVYELYRNAKSHL